MVLGKSYSLKIILLQLRAFGAVYLLKIKCLSIIEASYYRDRIEAITKYKVGSLRKFFCVHF